VFGWCRCDRSTAGHIGGVRPRLRPDQAKPNTGWTGEAGTVGGSASNKDREWRVARERAARHSSCQCVTRQLLLADGTANVRFVQPRSAGLTVDGFWSCELDVVRVCQVVPNLIWMLDAAQDEPTVAPQ
jgi:hypothetical protein